MTRDSRTLRTEADIRAAGAEVARRMKPLTDPVLDRLAVVLAPLAVEPAATHPGRAA